MIQWAAGGFVFEHVADAAEAVGRIGPVLARGGAEDNIEGDVSLVNGHESLAWYGDSAYGTGELRGAICDAGHDAVIKPKPLQAPVEGGFTIDDFTVDEQAGTVTCPAGQGRAAQPHPHRHLGVPAATARCASGAHDLQDRPQARPARTR